MNTRIENTPGAENRFLNHLQQAQKSSQQHDEVQLYIRSNTAFGGDGSIRLASLKSPAQAPLHQVLSYDPRQIHSLNLLLDNGAALAVNRQGQITLPRDFAWHQLSDQDAVLLKRALEQGLIQDETAYARLDELAQTHLSRAELQPYLPQDAPIWLRSLAGVAGGLVGFGVSQYEAHTFHPEQWQKNGYGEYPGLTEPSQIQGSFSRENHNPIALLKGGGSSGHFHNTAQLVTMYRSLSDALAAGVEAMGSEQNLPPAEQAARQAFRELLHSQQDKLQHAPAALTVLQNHLGEAQPLDLTQSFDMGLFAQKIRALATDYQLPERETERYLLQVGQLMRRFEDPLSAAEAQDVLQELEAVNQQWGAKSGATQQGNLLRQTGQASKELLAGYLAHRTLTSMGEIIEVTHNIGGAIKNLPFPIFDVPPLGPDGEPVNHAFSFNDLGDRIANTAGIAGLYLQEWLDPNGNLRVYSSSPFASNSGGSFTPTFMPLPDYPNIRPAFHAGLEYGRPGWGVNLGTVVNSVTGTAGLPKAYLDMHLNMGMAAGRHQVDMTFDPLDPSRLAPFMTPSTSMMQVGAYLEPNYLLNTTSPLLQNGRLDLGVTLQNPSSPTYATEFLQADGSVGQNLKPPDWKSYRLRYTLPVSNFMPRLERGWLGSGEFVNRFAENSRLGLSTAYNQLDGGEFRPGQNPRSVAGWQVAPYLSTQIVNLGGNEGAAFWEQIGEGVLRMMLAGAIQSGMNYGLGPQLK